ncbi:MAG: anaerobic ribonucleoside-triphosphate reductase activating protein [Campylobacterota bacterium]|nr:anaerobic ribonucleoside-triphosphate reductase activating protein [Campylobacterota bacterium]
MNISNDVSLLNKKIVYDLTPFSHLDFQDHLSCIVWLSGCNMRCSYCYNKDIVFAKNGKMTFANVLKFLDTRKNLLDAVVLSGGEATNHNLISFCKEVKNKGFKVKLDTNGINFKHIKELLDLNLIDYIALDYKAPKYKFEQITYSSVDNFEKFKETLSYLININFNFEIRTTVHNDLLIDDDINSILDDLSKEKYKGKYFLQNFLDTQNNIGNIKISSNKLNLENIQDNNDSIKIQFRNY